MNIFQAGRSVGLFVLILLLLFSFKGYTQPKQLQSETIKVWGTCGMCKSRIETSLREWGLDEASWNSNMLELNVLYDADKFSSADIQTRLAALGHATANIDAEEPAYKALPACCQYARVPSLPADTLSKPSSSAELDQVVIRAKRFSAYVSSLSTLNTLQMGAAELNKAACCNLSESFETNPSVDVSYADAVMGVKQIQLLGLSGSYTQMLREQLPAMRGLSGSYGLTFIPGPWIESIQLTKGIGSVLNGYESIAGQINIEEKKADAAQKLYVNAYGNDFERLEGSFIMNQQVTKSWNTAMLSHFNGVFNKMDHNRDGFLDMPLGRQVNLQNRWKYASGKAWAAQITLRYLSDDRQAGQLDFNPSTDKFSTQRYGVSSQMKQYEVSGKLGYIFPEHRFSSLAFAFSLNSYSDQSHYGLKAYVGQQQSVYAKMIYQSIIGTNRHQFSTGLSFAGDNYNESFISQEFRRYEIVPGSFLEYTYGAGASFTVIAGARADYHNQYRWLLTPRLALKYNLSSQTTLRFSGGSGLRTANILAENRSFMFSARQFDILGGSIKYAYGLHPEKAWNYGFNLTQRLQINQRLMVLAFDLYRTTFTQQAVIDIDTDGSKVLFCDLHGQSFSNSAQAGLNYALFNRFDLRLAYRWLDVQTNYSGKLLAKPLLAKHRALINLAYQVPGHWSFDYTLQWLGEKRLPGKMNTAYTPAYTQMMAQVSKRFQNNLELYLGGENLTNYQQPQAIIAADEPFSARFDGAQIWAPINGRMFYFGLRYQIK